MTKKITRPDFIIIGAMKSATSSLQEQLDQQPGIFTTEPKEPNFFSNDEIYSRGEDWYSELYSSSKPADLRGEASTHYAKLPRYPKTIERLQKFAPDAKLIYVMRHPLDRLVSHYVHNWTMGFVQRDLGIEDALKSYDNFVEYSRYSMQLKPWIEAYGKAQILPVFFDRVIRSPQAELDRICEFIGYDGRPIWRDSLDASNVSSQRIRKFPLYSVVVESSVATWLRKTLIPQRFRDAVKERLRPTNRPELSIETKARLEQVFDNDLAELGKLLGVELNCDNFKEKTGGRALDWI